MNAIAHHREPAIELNPTPDPTPGEARVALQAAVTAMRAAESACPADLTGWSRATRDVRTAMRAASKVLDEHELRRWRGVVADVRESTPLECALWPLVETLPETDAELLEQLRQLDACPCGNHWPEMVGKALGLPRQLLWGSAPNAPAPTAVEALLRSQTARNVRGTECGEELAEVAEGGEGVEFEVVTDLGEVAYSAAVQASFQATRRISVAGAPLPPPPPPSPSPGERSVALVAQLRALAHKAASATQPKAVGELERIRAAIIHGIWRVAAKLAGRPLRQAALFPPEPLEQIVARFVPILGRVETLQLDGETLLAELDAEFAEVAT